MPRLWRTRAGLTGWAWCMKAGFTSPGTVASELNANARRLRLPWRIVCQYESTKRGRKIYRYRYSRVKP
jgi:hypothetical protein